MVVPTCLTTGYTYIDRSASGLGTVVPNRWFISNDFCHVVPIRNALIGYCRSSHPSTIIRRRQLVVTVLSRMMKQAFFLELVLNYDDKENEGEFTYSPKDKSSRTMNL